MHRRSFLVTTALAGVAAATGTMFGARPGMAATAASADSFNSVSAFVTGQKGFDPVLVKRALGQLIELDADFGSKLDALGKAISDSGTDTIDAFLATDPSQDLRDTMTTITGVWYLGYTGQPDPSKEHDDAKFVTYRGALMWNPTSDATPIPTYSQHKQEYWAEPPAFMKQG